MNPAPTAKGATSPQTGRRIRDIHRLSRKKTEMFPTCLCWVRRHIFKDKLRAETKKCCSHNGWGTEPSDTLLMGMSTERTALGEQFGTIYPKFQMYIPYNPTIPDSTSRNLAQLQKEIHRTRFTIKQCELVRTWIQHTFICGAAVK